MTNIVVMLGFVILLKDPASH